jgi:predicted DsbA family dithiol-disulfide isomerase
MRRVEVWFDVLAPLSFWAHEAARTRWHGLADFTWVPWEAPSAPLDALAERRFAEENLPFREPRKPSGQRPALRAILWCQTQDVEAAGDFRDRVLRRRHERGLEVDHVDVLAGLAESAGYDPIAFLDDLKAGAFEAEVRANDAQAKALGVREAPTFVVGPHTFTASEPEALDEALRG